MMDVGLLITLPVNVCNILNVAPYVIKQMKQLITYLFHAVFPISSGFVCCKKVGLQSLVPQPVACLFVDWWAWTNDWVDNQVLQGLNSIIILGGWYLWTQWN